MLSLDEIKQQLTTIEPLFAEHYCVHFHTFARNERPLVVMLTERLYKIGKKERIWKSSAMLTALKNAEYGFDKEQATSAGGMDGIFLLTRNYKPANAMMKKLFNDFLDKPNSGIEYLVDYFKRPKEDFIAVRLVSHHLRLLGVLLQWQDNDVLILVDFDNTK